jgi:hypothetical protein
MASVAFIRRSQQKFPTYALDQRIAGDMSHELSAVSHE